MVFLPNSVPWGPDAFQVEHGLGEVGTAREEHIVLHQPHGGLEAGIEGVGAKPADEDLRRRRTRGLDPHVRNIGRGLGQIAHGIVLDEITLQRRDRHRHIAEVLLDLLRGHHHLLDHSTRWFRGLALGLRGRDRNRLQRCLAVATGTLISLFFPLRLRRHRPVFLRGLDVLGLIVAEQEIQIVILRRRLQR